MNPTASEMGKRRWSGTTPEQRREFSLAGVRARKSQAIPTNCKKCGVPCPSKIAAKMHCRIPLERKDAVKMRREEQCTFCGRNIPVSDMHDIQDREVLEFHYGDPVRREAECLGSRKVFAAAKTREPRP